MLKMRLLFFIVFILSQSLSFGQSNLYLKAKIAFDHLQNKETVEYLNQYLISQPKHNEAILLRAKANIELASYQNAIEDLLNLKSSTGDEYYLLTSRAYAGLNKPDMAIEQLYKYLNTNTKQPESVVKSFREFNILRTNDLWTDLWKNVKYSAKEEILHNAKFAIRSGNYAEAADRLDECLIKYPKSADALYFRGNVYFFNKDFKSALKCIKSALQIKPEINDYIFSQALCENKLMKYKTALDLFNKVIKKDSLNLSAFFGRSEAYAGLKLYDNARSDISKYLRYYPENTEAQFLKANIDAESGDYLSAIANFGKLIKTNPSRPEYFLSRANAYMSTKTYKYAIKDYSMALDLDPKNAEVFKLKAKAHQLNGEMKQACNEWFYAARLGDVESRDMLYKYGKQFGINYK